MALEPVPLQPVALQPVAWAVAGVPGVASRAATATPGMTGQSTVPGRRVWGSGRLPHRSRTVDAATAPSGRLCAVRDRAPGRRTWDDGAVRPVVAFFRENPQALVLLIITLVLGIGTFVAVLIALAGSGNGTPSGEPSDLVPALHAAVSWLGAHA